MRETTAPLMLSGCPPIPKGTLIAFANSRFDMSSPHTFDPDEFDGFRYSKVQAKAGETSQQLITASVDALTWGYGLHACPGRLYAATEIKVILAHLISNYDLRLREGESRPPNSSHDFQIMPHPEAAVVFIPRK
jgi:cytochrome P450